MADWGSAVVVRLAQDEAFTAFVGERVDWTVSPPETPFPRVVLSTISDPRPDHFGGAEDFRQTRLQLDAYSLVSADEARKIAEAGLDCLKPEWVGEGMRFDRAGADGPTDSGEQEEVRYIFRSRLDLLLWHAPLGEG